MFLMVWGRYANQFADAPIPAEGKTDSPTRSESVAHAQQPGPDRIDGSSAYEFLDTNAAFNLDVRRVFHPASRTHHPAPVSMDPR
jgi:hypothetical protein